MQISEGGEGGEIHGSTFSLEWPVGKKDKNGVLGNVAIVCTKRRCV